LHELNKKDGNLPWLTLKYIYLFLIV